MMKTRLSKATALAIVLKLALYAMLLAGLAFPDAPQFEGKGIGARLVVYPLLTLLVPALWVLFLRKRIAFPALVDLCVTLPFTLDTAGNVANLFDTVSWFDDVMHLVNWVPWVSAFGIGLSYSSINRWIVAGLTLGWGAVTHILWEIGEYFAFIRNNPSELAGAYQDTIGDLAMSLTGSFIGAGLVGSVLCNAVRNHNRTHAQTS